MEHTPVLHSEVIALLEPQRGERVLDVTLGLGGHAQTFLEKIDDGGVLIGLDADQENLDLAKERLKDFEVQLEIHHMNFRDVGTLDIESVDILFADLGLSSPHVDDPSRGFTYRQCAALDLRFDRSRGISAQEFIHASKEKDLADVLYRFGELKTSRKLACVIKEAKVMSTTFDLKDCVEKAMGYRAKYILPQLFQALRIAVNDELGALDALLREGPRLLRSGGRMGVICYHSLEDRMVKRAFRALAEPVKDPVTGQVTQEASFEVLTRKPIVPSLSEVHANPRARSAKLRVLRKIQN